MTDLLLILAIAVCSASCKSPAKVNSCGDSLDGVWRGNDGKRYHAITEGRRVDIYPMFNASRIDGDTDYAPFMFGFARKKQELVGKRTQRAERRGNTCTIRTDAAIRKCENNTLELRYHPMAAIDWARCRPAAKTSWVTLILER